MTFVRVGAVVVLLLVALLAWHVRDPSRLAEIENAHESREHAVGAVGAVHRTGRSPTARGTLEADRFRVKEDAARAGAIAVRLDTLEDAGVPASSFEAHAAQPTTALGASHEPRDTAEVATDSEQRRVLMSTYDRLAGAMGNTQFGCAAMVERVKAIVADHRRKSVGGAKEASTDTAPPQRSRDAMRRAFRDGMVRCARHPGLMESLGSLAEVASSS